MSTLLRSLYSRISAAYLLLLLLFCVVSIKVTINTSTQFMQESDQRLNQPLARFLAQEISPFLEDSLKLGAVEQSMHEVMAQNPRVEIYLLDEEGRIITYVAEPGDLKHNHIPTAPIQIFLEEDPDLPILGSDPRDDTQEKIFSAAPVPLGDDRGYVYIILQGKKYESVASMLKENYILQGAAVLLVLVFLFTAFAGLLLFAFLTGRLQSIVEGVEALKKGQYDQQLDVKRQDELGQIELAFNEMASTIQANMAVLESREDFRREFIANLSHDLKSPLTSIQGYLETVIMKNEIFSAEERMEYLQIVFEETALLDNLISRLLELSKLDAPQTHPKPEPFFVCELVNDVLIKYRPLAQRLEVTLETPLSYDLPMVYADIGMIERVLSNLIDNALRHTPAGEGVKVSGTSLDHRVRLFVRDTGYGIVPDDLSRVTERFYKGSSSRARTSGGTGLGLAIVKRILELHGSDLMIESTVNVGTTISFDLNVADLDNDTSAART